RAQRRGVVKGDERERFHVLVARQLLGDRNHRNDGPERAERKHCEETDSSGQRSHRASLTSANGSRPTREGISVSRQFPVHMATRACPFPRSCAERWERNCVWCIRLGRRRVKREDRKSVG